MSFVIPPTFDLPKGNPQLLASLGQTLDEFRNSTVGDEQRDNLLRFSPALSAADANFNSFWVGDAANSFSRRNMAARDRLRNLYRVVSEGGRRAITLAAAITAAQTAIAQAQQIGYSRAQQASTNPLPTDPYTLFGDLWAINSSVGSTISEAHAEASAEWNRLTQSAPHFVAPKSRPAETKRPWWKKALGVTHIALDAGGLVPGLGELADGANSLIYLGEGDSTNAALSAGAMIPFVGWGSTGAKYAIKADHAVDAARNADNIASSVGKIPPPRAPQFIEPTPSPVPQIAGVGGSRGNAGYGGRNPNPPGGPGNPYFGPTGGGSNLPRGPFDDAIRGTQLINPTIVFPRPAFGSGPSLGASGTP